MLGGVLWLRRARLFALVLLVALVGGCYSPTIPLPPPDEPELSQLSPEGMVTVRGGATRYALVSVFNQRSGEGVITTAGQNGGYEATLAAKAGDSLAIWQEVSGEKSPSIEVTVK